MNLSVKQREVLTLVGFGAHRRDLPPGHGVTQALRALVNKGVLAHDAVVDSYRRIG